MPRRKRATPEMLEIDRDFRDKLGVLVMSWANAESWLHRILAVLLRVDNTRAALVYGSFTSTRARRELVERAGIMSLRDARSVRHLQKLLRDFAAVSRLRNQLCHAMYEIDSSFRAAVAVSSLNFQKPDFDGTNHYGSRAIDRGLLNEMTQAHRKAVNLCGRLQRFVKHAPVLEQPRDTPLLLRKHRKTKSDHPRRRKR